MLLPIQLATLQQLRKDTLTVIFSSTGLRIQTGVYKVQWLDLKVTAAISQHQYISTQW